MTPLSSLQKREIAQLARRAYEAWSERDAFEAINAEQSKPACFESWRHVEQGKACGVQSLCACTQAHYGRLVAHFQALCGHSAAAMRTLVRDADNDRRIARYKLDEALRERGLGTGYAAAICQRQYRCDLDAANAKQLWRLVYTVRNRRKALPPIPETAMESNKQDPF
jgi:hypothetical protein